MSRREVLWVDTGAETAVAGELREHLRKALMALQCNVVEVNVGETERMLDAIAAGAVPVVFKAAAVD